MIQCSRNNSESSELIIFSLSNPLHLLIESTPGCSQHWWDFLTVTINNRVLLRNVFIKISSSSAIGHLQELTKIKALDASYK
jgi:hypothetical protein